MGFFDLLKGNKHDSKTKNKNEAIALLRKKHDANLWNFISTQKGGIPEFAGMILNTFGQIVKNNPKKSLQQHYAELALNMLGQASSEVANNKEMWSKWIVENGKNDFSLTFFFILFFIEEQVRQNSALGLIHIQLYLDLIYSKAIFNDEIPHHLLSQEERYKIAFESIQKEVNQYEDMKVNLLTELEEVVLNIYKERLNHYTENNFSFFEEADSRIGLYNTGLPNTRKFAKETILNYLQMYSHQELMSEAEIQAVILDAEKAYLAEIRNN